MSDSATGVRTGLDALRDGPLPDWSDARLGLLLNQASVDRQLRSSCDVVAEQFPGRLAALFSPQHGLWGEMQANMIESPHATHQRLGIPVFSLYSETRRPTPKMLAGIEVLLIDLQDVGTRVYTFVWTVLNCLRACAQADIRVVILDRPNPVGGTAVEGAVLDPGYRSFVGDASIPMRHGLTLGELSTYLNQSLNIRAKLECLLLQNWRRSQMFVETTLPWVPPSPNLPTPGSALVYPGQVLLEGTNLSEGRGTTTPFEVCGAPFVDPEWLSDEMNCRHLPGVLFRPVRFRPTFDKWAGEVCGGVALHVTDPGAFRPYTTTLTLLSSVSEACGDEFEWLPPPYEYETEKMPIDILSGDPRLRHWLDQQGPLDPAQIELLATDGIDAWRQATDPSRLYE